MSRRATTSLLLPLALGVVPGGEAAAFQATIRVSVDSAGAEANSVSDSSCSNVDGTIIAFHSLATNLVANDTNRVDDVFVHDVSTGTTERISVDSSGGEATSASWMGTSALSDDGQLVVFFSDASNFDPGDINGVSDVFLRDRAGGTTVRISVKSFGFDSNGPSYDPAISADGRFVCFTSLANNLVASDTNKCADIFVRDLAAGVTERISVDSNGAEVNGASLGSVISADGRFVAFYSDATNLVAGDTNQRGDVFVRDRQAGTTERVSLDSQGNQANDVSQAPSISGDGNFVAFASYATNLVAADTNQCVDVFVRDRALGTTTRVSVDSSGAEVDAGSFGAVMDPGGARVAFSSLAADLVAGDTNATTDAFLHDLATGETTRDSIDANGAEANGPSLAASISGDGMVVTLESGATNLVPSDTNGVYDVFARAACTVPATWTNYGSGFPGTLGIPSLTSQQFPSFGTTVTVDLANSYGAPTVGLLVLGFQRASLPTKWGGDLLVLPSLIVPLTLSFGSDSFTGTIPDDLELCGVTVDLQGIEADPGAQFGLSFSQGLELVIGN
jgi:Tol biopolymer transport system component